MAKHDSLDRSERPEVPGRPGPDLLGLSLTGVPRGRRTTVLVDQLRRALDVGAVGVGESLPPTRVLADQLGVSRVVVSEAYARLADEGLVIGRGRAGTIVARSGHRRRRHEEGSPPPPVVPAAREVLRAPTGNAGFELLRAAPCRVDLTPGRPDLSAFPRGAWLRAERTVLARTGNDELGYGDPRGSMVLREAVSRWLGRSRGLDVGAEEIVIVAGVAQAFSLLARMLLTQGRAELAVEDPCSLGARHQMASWGLSLPPVPVGPDGLRVDALRRTSARAVMVTPAHQFPTGVALSGALRRDLVDWARDVDGLIVEDDYDAEHRYDRSPVPALAAAAPDRTYYTGSVSKLLAPALRIGWVVPPPDLLGDVVDLKRETDLGNAVLAQLVLAEMFGNGALERHLRTARRRHQERRDALLAGLCERLRPEAVVGVAAGLHLTLRLPPHTDELAVAAELLEAHGIKVQPLAWHRQLDGPGGLVLGYATTTPDLLREAGRRIGQVIGGSAG